MSASSIQSLRITSLLKNALSKRSVWQKKWSAKTTGDYADMLASLYLTYIHQRQFEKALPLCQRVLAIRWQVLGESSARFAESLADVALLNWRLGRDEEAQPLYRQALAIAKRIMPANHPISIPSLNALADQYWQETGDHLRAEQLYLQALELNKEILGERLHEYANGLTHLGDMYEKMADYAKAEPLLVQAVDAQKKLHGEQHLSYARPCGFRNAQQATRAL